MGMYREECGEECNIWGQSGFMIIEEAIKSLFQADRYHNILQKSLVKILGLRY